MGGKEGGWEGGREVVRYISTFIVKEGGRIIIIGRKEMEFKEEKSRKEVCGGEGRWCLVTTHRVTSQHVKRSVSYIRSVSVHCAEDEGYALLTALVEVSHTWELLYSAVFLCHVMVQVKRF